MSGQTGRGGEHGGMAVELAITMPLLLALLASTMMIGRSANAVSAVEMAAYDAARTASLARDAGTATTQATDSVRESLRQQGYTCADGPQVEVAGVPDDPWSVPVGEPASVVVRVTCRVSYADIAVAGVPAGRTISRYFVSPLDQYRVRS
jgi:hypothetical protein